jgi:hypothetical protein
VPSNNISALAGTVKRLSILTVKGEISATVANITQQGEPAVSAAEDMFFIACEIIFESPLKPI